MEIRVLLEELESHIVYTSIFRAELGEIQGIGFLEEGIPCDPGVFWIAPADVSLHGERGRVEGTLFRWGCGNPSGEKTAAWENEICTSLGEKQLYAVLARFLRRWRNLEWQLERLALQGADLRELLQGVAELERGQFCVISAAGVVLAETPGSQFGLLADEERKKLVDRLLKERTPQWPEGGLARYPLLDNGCVTAIFLAKEYSCSDLWMEQVLKYLGSLAVPAISRELAAVHAKAPDYTKIVRDIFERRLTNPQKIQEALFPDPGIRAAVQIVVARLDREFDCEQNRERLRIGLQGILPEAIVVQYKQDVVMLYQIPHHRKYNILEPMYYADSQSFYASINRKLREMLPDYHARAAVSVPSHYYDRLRTGWLLCANTLKLDEKLRTDQGERLLSMCDYHIMNVIDYFAQTFMELHKHDDLIYLVSPEIVMLARYDKERNTNLLGLLEAYLLSGQNITKTARRMYMHRNTVSKNLEYIVSQTKLNLEDPDILTATRISLQIIRYYETYLGRKLDWRRDHYMERDGERRRTPPWK